MAVKHATPSPNDTLTWDVIDVLNELDQDGKREVLDFSRALARRRRAQGPGGALLAFAGAFDPADLAEMERAIEEECERVDESAW